MQVQEITTGLRFPEGPVAMADGSVVLVEIERGTVTQVLPDGTQKILASPGGGPNGAAIGPDGMLYICNNGGINFHEQDGRLYPGDRPEHYSGGRIERVNMQTGEVEVIYSECNGIPLCAPNDLVFDEQRGFWFTDHGKAYNRVRDRGSLLYAMADGSMIRECAFPLEAPNGVGLSPDGKMVYFAETMTARVWRCDITGPGGELSPKRRCIAGLPGLQFLDSLAVDDEGHICVATILNGGITRISPDGEQIQHIPLDDRIVTNICFGGKHLRTAYVTLSNTGRLVSFDWMVPGLRLQHQ